MQLSKRPLKSLKNIEGIQIHPKYENRRFPFNTHRVIQNRFEDTLIE